MATSYDCWAGPEALLRMAAIRDQCATWQVMQLGSEWFAGETIQMSTAW